MPRSARMPRARRGAGPTLAPDAPPGAGVVPEREDQGAGRQDEGEQEERGAEDGEQPDAGADLGAAARHDEEVIFVKKTRVSLG